MQVRSLGVVNTPVLQQDVGAANPNSAFADLLSGLVEEQNVDQKQNKLVAEDVQELSKEELAGILQFLNTSDSELEVLANKLLNQDANGKELANFLEESTQMDVNEALTAFINILPFVNIDQTNITFDKKISDITKALKLYELLSTNENSTIDFEGLKEFLQKISEKLELQLKENTQSTRSELLNKVFSPIAKELNSQSSVQQSLPGHSVASGVSKQLQISQKTYSFGNHLNPLLSMSKIMNNQKLTSDSKTNLDFLNAGIQSIQTFSKPDQLTLLAGQSRQVVSTEQLIQQFESILSKSQLSQIGGTQKMFIKLYPEHLGALRVELIQKDLQLIAKIMTTTSTAKEILESQLGNLRNAFSSQNIQLEKVEIFQQMNQQEKFLNRDQQQQQEQRQQREQQERKQQQEQSFDASFLDALLNVEV